MLYEDVQTFLHNHGIRLNTDLGQHYLIDETILKTIIETSTPKEHELLVEIGPGIGILTRELLTAGARVKAVEIDPRIIPLLRVFTGMHRNLEVIQGNALHTELAISEPYRIIANIPYHITSPLLHRFLLELKNRPTSMTLLIQKEVAENICASTTEGILTLLVGCFGKSRLVTSVPKECFLPPPQVESAIIHIESYEQPLLDRSEVPRVLTLAKHAMSQRRKMLRGSIGNLPHGLEALHQATIEEDRRPQTLTVEEWIRLRHAFDALQS